MKKIDKGQISTLSLDQVLEFEENIKNQIITKKTGSHTNTKTNTYIQPNTNMSLHLPPSSSFNTTGDTKDIKQPLHHHISSKKLLQLNSKPKSTTHSKGNHWLPLVTPNKSRLIFYYIDNKTTSIIAKSHIQYSVDNKMTTMKLIIDSHRNLSLDMKGSIDMNSIKLMELNTIGIIIEIANDNDSVNDLLKQYINNQLYLCFYLFDFDFVYDLKQPHQLVSFNFFKDKFYEVNTQLLSLDEIRYPYIACISKDSKAIQSDQSLSSYLINIVEFFGLNNTDMDIDNKYKLKLIANCNSSIRQITNTKMIKVNDINDMKQKEMLRLIKARLRENETKEIIRIAIESDKYKE